MLSPHSSAGSTASAASPVGNAAAAAIAMAGNEEPGAFETTLAQHLPSDEAAAKLLEPSRKAAKRQMLPEPEAEQAAIFAAMLQAGVLTQDIPVAVATVTAGTSAVAAVATAAIGTQAAATAAITAAAIPEAATTTNVAETAATTLAMVEIAPAATVATRATAVTTAATATAATRATAATTAAAVPAAAIPVPVTTVTTVATVATVDTSASIPQATAVDQLATAVPVALPSVQQSAGTSGARVEDQRPVQVQAKFEPAQVETVTLSAAVSVPVAVTVDSIPAPVPQRHELATPATPAAHESRQAPISLPAGMTMVFVPAEAKVARQLAAETAVVAAAPATPVEASRVVNPVAILPAAPAASPVAAVAQPAMAVEEASVSLAAQVARPAGHAEVSVQVPRLPVNGGDGQATVVAALVESSAKDSNPGNADLPQQGRSDTRPSKDEMAPAGLPAGLVLQQQAAGNQAALAPVEAALPALKADAVATSNPDVLAASNGVPGRLQMQLQTETMGPLTLDMKMDGNGQAHLVVHAASETLRQSLDGRRDQLVDTMQGLGLALQVDVGRGGQPSSSDERNQAKAQAAGSDQDAPTASATAAIALPRSKPQAGTSRLNFYA